MPDFPKQISRSSPVVLELRFGVKQWRFRSFTARSLLPLTALYCIIPHTTMTPVAPSGAGVGTRALSDLDQRGDGRLGVLASKLFRGALLDRFRWAPFRITALSWLKLTPSQPLFLAVSRSVNCACTYRGSASHRPLAGRLIPSFPASGCTAPAHTAVSWHRSRSQRSTCTAASGGHTFLGRAGTEGTS